MMDSIFPRLATTLPVKIAQPGYEPATDLPSDDNLLPCFRDFFEEKDEDDSEIPVGWPKKMWVLAYSVDGEAKPYHAIIKWFDAHGLAVFRKRSECIAFATKVQDPPSRAFKADEVTFEQAEAIARAKKSPINAMILVADPALVHYFR